MNQSKENIEKESRFLQEEIINWFLKQAIPFWSNKGIDYLYGGFFEEVNQFKSIYLPKRTRVVSRQIYSFYVAYKFKSEQKFIELIDYGADFLFSNLYLSNEHYFAYSIDIKTQKLNKKIFLYEQAFGLISLAIIFNYSKKYKNLALSAAKKIITKIKRIWGISIKEINSSNHRNLLLLDPYMHLLEALLFWHELSKENNNIEQSLWKNLCKELINSTMKLFINEKTNFIHEAISLENKQNNISNDLEKKVIPGHQYEWGSLLIEYGLRFNSEEHKKIGKSLITRIEHLGVDKKRNIVINELNDSLKIRDNHGKIWPQTERLKAWGLISEISDPSEKYHIKKYLESLIGLDQFLDNKFIGCWREFISPDGHWIDNNVKASSFYHIASAINTIKNKAFN